MAIRSLSPKRAAERMRQHRHAVVVLARQSAKKLVVAQIHTKGLRPANFTAREITELADAELERNRAQLIAEAEHTIETWPGFARWRIPPGHEVFVKFQEIEHSTNVNSGS
jgi:hypothetical protein